MTTQSNSTGPAFNIYTRRKKSDGTNDLGIKIGVGFAHQNGDGFNIVLDAAPIPTNGRIELVAFPVKEKE